MKNDVTAHSQGSGQQMYRTQGLQTGKNNVHDYVDVHGSRQLSVSSLVKRHWAIYQWIHKL